MVNVGFISKIDSANRRYHWRIVENKEQPPHNITDRNEYRHK